MHVYVVSLSPDFEVTAKIGSTVWETKENGEKGFVPVSTDVEEHLQLVRLLQEGDAYTKGLFLKRRAVLEQLVETFGYGPGCPRFLSIGYDFMARGPYLKWR